MLRDLEKLGKCFQKRFSLIHSWPEISFDEYDQKQLEISFENLSLKKMNRHSFELLIDNRNSCVIPSQYLVYAVFVKEFAIVLKDYVNGFDKLRKNDSTLANNIKSKNVDLTPLETIYDEYSLKIFIQPFDDPNKRLHGKDIVNRDGNTGNFKLRGSVDLFSSIILKVINVADTNSSILGRLIYELADHPHQFEYFENKIVRQLPFTVNEPSIKNFIEQVLRFIDQNNKLPDFFNLLKENDGNPNLFSIKTGPYNLTSIFKKSQKPLSDPDLRRGDKLRYFQEPFYYDNSFYYLSTEWTNERGSRLDFQSFRAIFSTIYPSYSIIENKTGFQLSPTLVVASSTIQQQPFKKKGFIASLSAANLSLAKNLPHRFIAALQTKPFIILTGLSGSGKTKLAEALALWLSESPDQYCMVAVGADWTNREPLLGFPNALDNTSYVKPECGALELILRAEQDQTRPYFLILDEMNMSHVERYFADFLSAMESTKKTISLHSSTEDMEMEDDTLAVPSTVTLPTNLFIIGTVNIDETTYMFSPKVLDRASVIEFRVSETEMKSFFETPTEPNMEALDRAGAGMGASFVTAAQAKGLITEDLASSLMPFFIQLQEAGAEFGYRTASEISRFIKICTGLADDDLMTKNDIIDAAIIQKLLPKLHGSRNKIENILKELGKLCLDDPQREPFQINGDKTDKHPIKYSLSYEKLKRMHKRVLSDGFTSFAEA